MTVTQKQWNGVFLAGGLLILLVIYSFIGMAFLMGWSWEEVVRSVPSPELPPISPIVWHAFEVAIAGLSLAIVVVGLAWLRQRWQPTLTSARQGSIRQQLVESEQLRQQAERRAAQAVADAMTADAQRDVAQSALEHQSKALEALQEARRKDFARFRAMLEKRANAVQVVAAPAYPDLRERVQELERQLVAARTLTLGKPNWRKAIALIAWLRTAEKLPARATRDQLRVAFEIPEAEWEEFKASVYAIAPLSGGEVPPTTIAPATDATDGVGEATGTTDGRAPEVTDAPTDAPNKPASKGYWLTAEDISSIRGVR